MNSPNVGLDVTQLSEIRLVMIFYFFLFVRFRKSYEITKGAGLLLLSLSNLVPFVPMKLKTDKEYLV